MPSFAILRDLDPTLTRRDIDAGAIQTLVNLGIGEVVPERPNVARYIDVQWVRTYWSEGTPWAMCLYTAPEPEQIALYHEHCGLEYVEFNEVDELASPAFVDRETGATLPAEEHMQLFAMDAVIPAEIDADATSFERLDLLLGRLNGDGVHDADLRDVRWIRTYWDEPRRVAVMLCAAPSRSTVERLAKLLSGAGLATRPVVEVTPAEYLGS